VQFKGSRLAQALLRLAGWRLHFEGLPGLQGVLVIYPHTSNWDFVVMVLAKWAFGVPAQFWAKDRLFRIPLFDRWLRWLGGVPVDRTSSNGVTAQAVDILRRRQRDGQYFWLALAPEGTRKYLPGLRSGFYRTALGAGVPLGLVKLDYGRREVKVVDFMALTGDAAADVARIAAAYRGVQALVPGRAAPLVLLDPSVPRVDTITT
jgi:1-acyl-sn-glycerol-3-phosphate acyltransferase